MAISFVRSAEGTSSLATTTPTFGSAPAAGNLVVLTFSADDYNGTPDSGWTQSAEMDQETFHGGYLWWLISAGGAVPSYTIGSASGSAWVISEFSGVHSSPYDISEGQFQATSTGSYTTPNITPTTGERLLVAMIGGSNTSDLTGTTPSSILNSFSTANWIGNNTGGTKQWVAQFYRTVTGDGSTTFSTGCSWGISMQSKSGLIVSFKESSGAAPGPTVTPVTPTSSTSNVTSYASSSFTPVAGDLLVVYVVAGATVGAGTMTGTGGATFTRVGSYAFTTTTDTVYCFVANGPVTGTSQTVTFDCSADAADGALIAPFRISGMANYGLGAVRQQAGQANGAAAATPAPAFTRAALSSSVLIGCVGNSSTPAGLTPPSGFLESTDTSYATPTTGGEWCYATSGISASTITWGSTSATAFGAMVVELDPYNLARPRPSLYPLHLPL